DNNGEKIPRPGLFPPVRVNAGTGFIVENSYRSYFEKTLKDLHSPYQCKEFGPLTLYFGMAQSDKTVEGFSNLYWSGSLLLKRGVEK
ncbi:MAG: hypothetical protein C0407_14080, partial [Desulfobacca sp.]|nr:hypothetical protein [Desulfobacca sp.]